MEGIILGLREDRVRLLKAGLTGKQVERVFIVLNRLNVVNTVLYEPDGAFLRTEQHT